MKIFVTGSSGHLGEALVRTSQNRNEDYVSLDVKPSAYTSVVGSITDRETVRACMKDVSVVYHTATLHKPHVATHGMNKFIDINIHGTLVLLEEAVKSNVTTFVFTSTTSVFGDALRPPEGEPAAWITEKVTPIPKNIYGVTKTAAEDLCNLFHRKNGLNCIVLRTSRFFLEEDDDKEKREGYEDGNLKVNEFLFRRVDLEDVVKAHLLANEKASSIGFGKYIISATTPFKKEYLVELRSNANDVLRKRVPEYEEIYETRGWKMFDSIDRVYVNDAARKDLKWEPKYDFTYALNLLKKGSNPLSPLAMKVGLKGYHSEKFEEGPYPVE